MRLIDAEPIEKFIENGLNCKDERKRFGHDAVEILTEVHYAPTIVQSSLLPNPPLTLEELREMDGPIWCRVDDCSWIPNGGFWCLCSKGALLTPGGTRYNCEDLDMNLWRLYRRKPEEGCGC